MRTQQWKIAAIVLAVVAGGAAYAWADVAATVNVNTQGFSPLITFSGTPWNTGGSYGWRFFVTKPMVITHLGVFAAHRDDASVIVDDGLRTTHQMGIWGLRWSPDAQGSTIDLLRGPLPIGPGGTVEDHYTYVSVGNPLTMTPNDPTYSRLLIGVWSGSNNTDLFYHSPRSAETLTAQQAGAIQLQNYTYMMNTATFGLPWGQTLENDGIEDSSYFALNFKYTLVGSNQSPVANNDNALTQINTPVTISVLVNDSDPDGDALGIESYTQGSHGTVTRAEGGLVYTPSEGFVGSDSFTYIINDGKEKTATATVSVTVAMAIDIKPGSYPNSVNMGAYGVVPVAILSTTKFDATTLDPDIIFLEGASVAIRGKGNKSMSHVEDVNGDGITDLVVQFDTENFDPDAFRDGIATVTVGIAPLVLYQGEDTIVIVPAAP